jgi:hypothetical protein
VGDGGGHLAADGVHVLLEHDERPAAGNLVRRRQAYSPDQQAEAGHLRGAEGGEDRSERSPRVSMPVTVAHSGEAFSTCSSTGAGRDVRRKGPRC